MTAPTDPAAAPRDEHQSANFAVLVAAGIFLSRIAGLVREKVFAHYFGNSDAAGVFRAAMRIPNFLQNMLGEGVLSASFIPVYARLLAKGDDELAGRVAGAVAAILSLIVATLVLLGILLTPQLLFMIAPGFKGDVRALTILVVRILFPAIGLLVLYAWCLGIMNSHRKFFLAYVAPVLMNIAAIATLLIFGPRVDQRRLASVFAWGWVVGAALQLGILIPFVFHYEKRLKFVLDTALEPVREVLRSFVPVAFGRGVVQVSAYLDNLLASLLGRGTVAVSGLGYAQTIYLLPISLFGMSVAAAELPQMSGTLGSDEEIYAAMRTRMERGLRQIAFFVVPSVVAFLAIGNVLIAALYQGGHFGPNDTLFVWYILIGSTVGMLAVTLGRLYSSAFYALRDPKTPLRFAMLRVALTGVLGWLFAFPLRPLMLQWMAALHIPIPALSDSTASLGAIGLTASAGVAGWIEFALLRRALARRTGAVRIPRAYLAKLWISAIAAGIAGAAFNRYVLARVTPHLPRILPHIRDAIVICGLFGLVYFAVAMLLGLDEARGAVRRVMRR